MWLIHTRRVLRCGVCKQTRECTADDVLTFAVAGWPRCCGEAMALDVETTQPIPPPPRPPDTP